MPAPTTDLRVFYSLTKTAASYTNLGSDSGNNGIDVNLTSRTTGTVGFSRHFTGNQVTASASCVALSTFGAWGVNATVMAWVRPDDVLGARFPWCLMSSANNRMRFVGTRVTGGTTAWLATGGGNAATSKITRTESFDLTVSKWYHLAVTYAGNAASAIYSNGTALSSVTPTGATFWSDIGHVKRIGNNLNSSGWVGDIDEFRIYDRQLSSTEIANAFADSTEYPTASAGGYSKEDEYYPATQIAFKFPVRRGK